MARYRLEAIALIPVVPVTAVIVAAIVITVVVTGFPVLGRRPRVAQRRVIPRRRAHQPRRIICDGWRTNDARWRAGCRGHYNRSRVVNGRTRADGD